MTTNFMKGHGFFIFYFLFFLGFRVGINLDFHFSFGVGIRRECLCNRTRRFFLYVFFLFFALICWFDYTKVLGLCFLSCTIYFLFLFFVWGRAWDLAVSGV